MKLSLAAGNRAVRPHGFTLIELLVGLTLGVLVLFALVTLFVNNSRMRREIDQASQQIENGRYALDLLRDDLHLAGYYGDAVPQQGFAPTTATIPNVCATDVANLQFVAPPAALQWPVPVFGIAAGDAVPACVSSATGGQKAGTDILVVRRTSTMPTTGALTATKVYLQASGCKTELEQHKDFVVDVGANAGTFARTKKGCAAAGDIYEFETRIYYVSNETVPTLRLLTLSGTSSTNEPLVEGIEDMRFEYGRDNIGSDGAPDELRRCLSTVDPCVAADWANMVAVRVNLLARNITSGVGYTDTKTYTLGRRERSGAVRRPLQAARLHRSGAADESGGPKGALNMMRNATSRSGRREQRGISLVVGLIMLVLLTLLAISAFHASNVNLRIAGNMQVRQEILAAAQTATEAVLSTPAFTDPTTPPAAVTVNLNGASLYRQFHAGSGLQEHRRHPERRSCSDQPGRFRVHPERCATGCEFRDFRRRRAVVAVVLLELALDRGGRRGRREYRRQDDTRTRHRCPNVESQGLDRLPVINRFEMTFRGTLMSTIRSILAAALAGLLLVPNLAHPEDIDLYTGASSGGDANVLIVLDNESNWAATMDSNPPADADTVANCGGVTGSYYCAQKYALIKLLERTDAKGNYFVTDNVGIGLMMYGSGTNKGGYIRFGIRKMTAINRAALIKLLKDMPIDDKGSSNQDFGYMMWEAFKYFGGGTGSPWSSTTWGPIPTNGVGVGTDKRDYPGNATVGSAYWANNNADLTPYAYTSSSTALSGADRVEYKPPTHPSECGKNYVVYIGHSNSQNNTNSNQDAQALFIGVGGSSTQVNPGSGSSGDEGARYLFNSDVDPAAGTQSVITYTIGTYSPPATGQIAAMITTMKSMARQGGGSYYPATDIQKLVRRLVVDPRGNPGHQQHVRFGVAAGQREHAGNVPEPGVSRNVPARCGRQPEVAGQRQAVPAQIRCHDRRRTPRRRRRPRRRRCKHGLRVGACAKLLDDLVDFLDQLGSEQDHNRERFQGRPRSAERRRGAAVARCEPDDAGQSQGVHVRGERDDRHARLRW